MFLQGGHYEPGPGGFPPDTMNVIPGFFHGKIEENKPLACCFYLVSLNLRGWPDFSAKW